MKVIRPFALILSLLMLTLCFGCSHALSAKVDGSRPVQGEQMQLEESSMNFDSENVRPFLERLKPLVESGFTDNEISQVQKMIGGMKIDEEKELEFPIQYHGEKSVLRVRIFMDDVDSPDIYFFTHPKLAQEIDRELEKFADENGL